MSPAKKIRDGKGAQAYRRASKRLKRETQAKGLVCTWCKRPIDTTLPKSDRMSFTADHPIALENGGALVGQILEPMHRACNSAKNKSAIVEVDEFGAS